MMGPSSSFLNLGDPSINFFPTPQSLDLLGPLFPHNGEQQRSAAGTTDSAIALHRRFDDEPWTGLHTQLRSSPPVVSTAAIHLNPANMGPQAASVTREMPSNSAGPLLSDSGYVSKSMGTYSVLSGGTSESALGSGGMHNGNERALTQSSRNLRVKSGPSIEPRSRKPQSSSVAQALSRDLQCSPGDAFKCDECGEVLQMSKSLFTYVSL